MLPEAFKKRILHQPYIDPESLFRSLEAPSPVSIRINGNKWNRSPVNSEPVLWCRSGFYLDKRPSFTLDPLFHSGCYYPQEASGMFLEEIMKQIAGNKTDMKVLDLCGAPGGKSTHLSSIIGRNGFLVSNEVIRQRSVVLAETLTKWGLSNAIVTQNDPESFTRLPGLFDLILVDAPCSGEGMFRDVVAINEWSVDNADLCTLRQKRILMNVWPALREDGILIYSTCTFNPGENEENIRWLTESKEAESVIIDVSEYEGITEIDYEGIHGYGFYPGRIRGEGLFFSVVRKRGSGANYSHRLKKGIEHKISREEKSTAARFAAFTDDRLLKFGDDIIGAPCNLPDFQLLSRVLNIVKPGTRIFKARMKNSLPSHELALSVFLKDDAFPSFNIELNDAISFLRRDNFKNEITEKGWNIVTYKDKNLGFINNIGSRYNNYFPVEWRIRMRAPEEGLENIIEWNINE